MIKEFLKDHPVMIIYFIVISFLTLYFPFEILLFIIYIIFAIMLTGVALDESHVYSDTFMIKLFTGIAFVVLFSAATYKIVTYEKYDKIIKTIDASNYDVKYWVNNAKDTLYIYLFKDKKRVQELKVSDKYLEDIDKIKKGNFKVIKKESNVWWSQTSGTKTVFGFKKD